MVGNTRFPAVVVVDASVVLAELLPDETNLNFSKYFDGLVNLEVIMFAPQLLKYEFANSLKSAVLRKRVTPKNSEKILKVFLGLAIKYEEIDYGEALKKSVKYNLSYYDASYLQLAKEKGVKLLSFDKRLVNLTK